MFPINLILYNHNCFEVNRDPDFKETPNKAKNITIAHYLWEG